MRENQHDTYTNQEKHQFYVFWLCKNLGMCVLRLQVSGMPINHLQY